MFLENKYSRWYYSIVDKRKLVPAEGYGELHHIIPACLGGTEMVKLTAREHFICHLLLTKMLEGQNKRKMIHAAWLMANMISKNQQRKRVFGRTYEYLRKAHAVAIGDALRGLIRTEEQRAKYRKPKSAQARLNMSKARIGIIFKDEHRNNLSKVCSGKQWMNNGNENKMVYSEMADKLISAGWTKGKIMLQTPEAIEKRQHRRTIRKSYSQTEKHFG